MSGRSTAKCRFAEIDVKQLADVSVTEAALAYARERISIIPLASDDSKRSLVRWKPYQRQPASLSVVERWFTHDFRDGSIGVVAGKLNGVLGIDIDDAGDAEFFFETFPETRNTLTVTTPHGLHLYFQYREGCQNRVGILGRKIDVRTSGGYLRAPTSAGYRFVNEGPILAPPLELMAAITDYRRIPRRRITGDGDLIFQNYRNDTIFRIGCGLQANGYSDDQIFNALGDINASRVSPPLPMAEVEEIFRSVTSRYPKGTARTLAAMTYGCVDPGNYICRAIRQFRVARKDRETQVLEWQDIGSGRVFPQYFNSYRRFTLRSKAVVSYALLFGELPRRLDRIDFSRFIGATALVHVDNSNASARWLRQYPGLTMPEMLIESRVTDVICALPHLGIKYS